MKQLQTLITSKIFVNSFFPSEKLIFYFNTTFRNALGEKNKGKFYFRVQFYFTELFSGSGNMLILEISDQLLIDF